MFLEKEELRILTGRKGKKRQIDALSMMGIAFHVNAAGYPVVLREALKNNALAPKAWTPRVLRNS